jgi:hypothetical protein
LRRARGTYPSAVDNSGVYLRGRYEVQIEDNFGEEPDSHNIGGTYGFLMPIKNAAKKSDEWQTLEITLVGRAVTVVLNGAQVIDRQAFPGSRAEHSIATKARPGRSCCKAITARSSSGR